MRTQLAKGTVLASALTIAAALSGCGGGGSAGSQSAALPPGKTTPASKANALATIVIPARTGKAHSRKPSWISPSTQSIDLADTGPDGINGFDTQASLTSTSPNCGIVGGNLTCTVPFAVVPGTNTITATLYDTTLPFRTANPLATQTIHVSIAPGANNPVNFLLNGIPAGLGETAPNLPITSGVSGTSSVFIVGVDADGNNILTGQFDSPVSLNLDDSTGGLSLNPGSISNPQLVNITYNGTSNTATSRVQGCSTPFFGGNPNCAGGALITVQVPSQSLYVGFLGATPIQAFAPGSNTPIRTLSGPSYGVAVASNGTTFGSGGSTFCTSVAGASTTSFNTLSSTQTCVSGAATSIVPNIGDIAVDTSGNTYLADTANSTILVYASGAAGNAAPISTISGPATQLSSPVGLAINGGGYLYVAQGNAILKFAPGANGNVAPVSVISGASTQLNNLQGIAVDSSGNIYTAGNNGGVAQISIFSPASIGNVAPARAITGAATGMAPNPIGVAVDNANNLFVSDTTNNRVLVFPASGNGNIPSIRQIFANQPAQLAIRP